MSIYSKKEDLLANRATEMPTADITLRNGGNKIKVQALKGTKRAELADMAFSERLYEGILVGLLEPRLSPKETKDFIDFNSDAAMETYREIMKLSGEFSQAESVETEKAEKN